MVKMEDIAKKLNISRTTVARALNGSNDIKPETKERILEIAREMGYRRNPISVSLASKKNKVVYAFIIKSKNKYYTSEIRRGLEQAEKEMGFVGYDINIVETDIDTPELQIDMLKKVLQEESPQGIIITPLLKNEVKKLKDEYCKVRFMTLDIGIDNSIFHVGPDYFKSGRIAADILVNVLPDHSKLLVLEAEDDRVSSKLYTNGFIERIREDNKVSSMQLVYSEKLMSELDAIIEQHLKDDVNAVYSGRFLVDIVEHLQQHYPHRRIKVVGNGMSHDMAQMILDGKIVATVSEKCFDEGLLAGKHMFDMLCKGTEHKEHKVTTKSQIVFRENLL